MLMLYVATGTTSKRKGTTNRNSDETARDHSIAIQNASKGINYRCMHAVIE